MRIIKVNAIDSTNSFVRKFYEGGKDFEPVCVRAVTQTAGRGQRGSDWLSKAGENLTFSILYPQKKLNISRHFLLSATVALAVLEGLQGLNISDLKVKWPNDILSAKKKIGGILIENIVKTEGIVASVIGIGLNVNQTDFEGLPQAGSLKSITGQNYNIDDILENLILKIETKLKELPYRNSTEILEEYAKNMFRLNVVSAFLSKEGDKFNGIIRGVTTEGKLNLEIEDAVFKTYDLKEIQLLY
ncbi:BirA family biotin operon repressor/biotin-[acetyl-CoA-carboxylase] ligase [Christiangramia gaetbulicola]|uniref:BirA family biotin operon repressor/biotin-[acetyl-CoA-carboxylase] ligase n=1 Tax=Christiangramia gaetbulicola TaxID=703340 RepID=A0A2T6AEB6_9FLAO|nr:biotin--[acetyl-CoA-carboxylase] ligase [Christiangramia gaetbulicola]PTX42122.1 BirA family biotin operon repressor/biotin-[acetyl-CoA-carboxylase] ligase [Christiangramia gaetbulicola]